MEPLKFDIDVSIDWRFADANCIDERSYEFDAEAADPPEPMTDGKVDLGEAMVQQLALEIEAFPRTNGLPFTQYTTGSAESAPTPTGNGEFRIDNPFRALKYLKEKLD